VEGDGATICYSVLGAEDFDSVESALMLEMVSLINRVSGRQRRYRCGG